jgi:nucleoside-diphosphate-sugar epimerase
MISIFGSTGFIGSQIYNYLISNKMECKVINRNDTIDTNLNLGHIVYCIGMTADFRSKPFETIEAHVTKLSFILKNCKFDSFTYFSSARMYINSIDYNIDSSENNPILINPNQPFDIFASSKLTGELLSLNCGKENIRIVRPSNVYGFDVDSDNFLTSIIKDAIQNKSIHLRTTLDSSKDYVSIEDICRYTLGLIFENKYGIFNLSSGYNISNKEIIDVISSELPLELFITDNAEQIIFPIVNNSKIIETLNIKSINNLLIDLPGLIKMFLKKYAVINK